MSPKLTKHYLFLPIIIVLLSLSTQDVFAQPPAAKFQVVHLPRKAGYSKEKLNTELALLKDKEAVKKLLRSKNFPSQTSIVIHVSRSNNQSAYWTINTSLPTDKEDNRIIMQSRDNAATKFFKLSEFKSFFKDTLAIIDTLRIDLFIKDQDYPDDQYMISWVCSKNKQAKGIPFDNGRLIFTKPLTENCKQGLASITLYNNNNPQRILASFKMIFVSAEQQEMLLSMAAFIKSEEPGKAIKDVALILHGYAINHFGRLHFPQLLNWLEKNNAALKYGDNQ